MNDSLNDAFGHSEENAELIPDALALLKEKLRIRLGITVDDQERLTVMSNLLSEVDEGKFSTRGELWEIMGFEAESGLDAFRVYVDATTPSTIQGLIEEGATTTDLFRLALMVGIAIGVSTEHELETDNA